MFANQSTSIKKGILSRGGSHCSWRVEGPLARGAWELPGGLTRDLKGKVLEVLLCNISE